MFHSIQSSVIKTSKGCTMGGPLSVYSCRNLYDKDGNVVMPLKPIFYRFVDDIINHHKKNVADELF